MSRHLRLSRRDLLLSGAAAGLAAAARAGATTPTGATTTGAAPRHLIVVIAEGGWDVTHCFDPKLGVEGIEGPEVDRTDDPADVEEVRTFGAIPIVVNDLKRPKVTAWFERWSARAHVVNGIWMGAISHDPCRFRILTGTALGTNPDLATITGFVKGDTEPLGCLDLSGWGLPGRLAASTGRVGYQSQLKALIDPDTVLAPPDGSDWVYPLLTPDPTEEAAIADWLRARAGAFGAARADGGHNDQRIDDLLQSWERGQRFRDASVEVVQGLVLGQQPDLELQISIAADLLQSGLCRTVTLDSGINWDTHEGNARQHDYFDALFGDLDRLAAALEERGLLDQTLVAVLSEMTRTPKLNAGLGKDHWAHASALFFGGGIRGGVSSGATDGLLESLPVDLRTGTPDPAGAKLKYDNLAAGVLEWMEVDPAEWLPGVEPFRGFV